MEIVNIESVGGNELDIKVAKRFKRIICSRGCNVMRLKTANFSEVKAGEVLYDAIINDVGTVFFRKSIYGEYYGCTIQTFFSEYDTKTIAKIEKMNKLREQMRDILTEINIIESNIETI